MAIGELITRIGLKYLRPQPRQHRQFPSEKHIKNSRNTFSELNELPEQYLKLVYNQFDGALSHCIHPPSHGDAPLVLSRREALYFARVFFSKVCALLLLV
jgi:hypothetical protein